MCDDIIIIYAYPMRPKTVAGLMMPRPRTWLSLRRIYKYTQGDDKREKSRDVWYNIASVYMHK